MVLLMCLLGGVIGFYLSSWSLYSLSKSINKSYVYFISTIWVLPLLSSNSLIYYPLLISNIYLKTVDYG